MVWPPPKIQATPEGEAPREARDETRRDQPELTGAYGASSGALPSALPPDWLQHPEKLVGAVLGGRYRITGLLGRGPMGFAVEGESSRGRQVTLKLMPRPPELSVERFDWHVREALAMAHFDHENVIASTDFGPLEGGGAFVSRSRVPAVTLRAALRQGPLPLRRALDLGRQIAAALAAGHAQEISHGRLKPENVLVTAGAQSADLVKVIDFGMAQLPVDVRFVVGGESEARRLALRTRMYLPRAHLPGIEALPPSPAVDVYSLGVVLFELITGQPPFSFDSAGWPHLQSGPLGFAQCSPQLQLPAAVDEIVSVLLRADSGVSAAQALGALESLLGRTSVAPVPAPAPVQAEPVTSQRAGSSYPERAPSVPPPPPSERAFPPEPRAQSFPPLPPGFPVSQPPAQAHEAGPFPAPPGPFPPLPAAFPPPPAPAPSGSYPPLTLDQNLLGSLQPPPPPAEAAPFADTDDEDAEAEFRPSLIARLRRMFGRSKPGGGL